MNTYVDDLKLSFEHVVKNENLQNKAVMITGATGLIGSAIAEVLIEANKNKKLNMKIYLGGRSIDKLKKRFLIWDGRFSPFYYEASKPIELFEHVDYIIHCASNAHPLAYSNKPVETIMTNVIGTNNVLVYARDNNVSRVLYISSSEVYGNKANSELYTEDNYYSIDCLNPRACYPSSKRTSETLCVSYIKEYDLDTIIVRPGHIYGPTITESDSRAHAQFARDVLNNRDVTMKSAGMQLRSYCHVLDCASAILTVLLCGKKGEAYNISNIDSVCTIKEFAGMHAKLTGHKLIFENPNDAESAGYNMMSNSALSADKLYALGWQGQYDLSEGINETIYILKSKK